MIIGEMYRAKFELHERDLKSIIPKDELCILIDFRTVDELYYYSFLHKGRVKIIPFLQQSNHVFELYYD